MQSQQQQRPMLDALARTTGLHLVRLQSLDDALYEMMPWPQPQCPTPL
jgi:hypothetical protein